MVMATQELLEYQDSIFREDEEVTMVKISRNEDEQLKKMEDFCQLLVEHQQLSEIVEEDTDREKTMNKQKIQKSESLVSRNVISMKNSLSSSQLRNIGCGLGAKEEDTQRSSLPFTLQPVENEDMVQTARISCVSSVAPNDFDGDSSAPQLRPEDLEEMASIFDKIRLIYKKRVSDQTPQPKKLIAKSVVNKIDDLAVEFDKKLSQVMLALSKVLKDQSCSNSQKWAEIEKVKFDLQSYVLETAIKFL